MDSWLRFGDESQREVLSLGVSFHKYQRYALIFLFISQTLRRRKKTISWAITCARHGAGCLYRSDFPQHRWTYTLLFPLTRQARDSRCTQGHTASK